MVYLSNSGIFLADENNGPQKNDKVPQVKTHIYAKSSFVIQL